MDITRRDQSPLFGNVAVTDTVEMVGDVLVTDDDQRRLANPLTGWIGRLSVGEHFSEAIAAGQAQAHELLNNARRLQASAKAGAVAVQGYGRSVAMTTSKNLNRVGLMIRNTPEAVVDGLCLVAMGGLALMGATGWDTRRDRLERYTLLPGEQRHYWGNPLPPSQPRNLPSAASLNAGWQQARPYAPSYPSTASTPVISPAPRQRHDGDPTNGMPAWLSPLYQQIITPERDQARFTQEQADLITRYLAEFLGGSPRRYPTVLPLPTAVSRTQHLDTARELRTSPTYRRIRVRIGAITMAFAGPVKDIYDQVGTWRDQHPSSVIISDEPVLV